MLGLGCRAVSKVQQDQSAPQHTKPPLGYRTREGRKTRNRQRNLKRKEKRSKHRCSAFPVLLVNDITYLTRGTQVILHLLCMCVSEQSCPASGVLDVDCNQGHMTLPQEVLQQRTGSRNTRTTSLVSLVPNLTANRSSGHSGNGCGWWCVHKCAKVLYICICVCEACRLVLMTYLFTECNESRLCVFSRVRAKLGYGWACRQITRTK